MTVDKKQPLQGLRSNSSDNNVEIPEQIIRKLSELLKATDLAEIEVSLEKMKIRVKAKDAAPVFVQSPTMAASAPQAAAVSSGGVAKKAEPQTDLHIIRSPFIGTFYRSPSPTTAPFVELNQPVAKGQALCIVEAMKLMNEIEADAGGVIEKVYVENGTPVEFNTPLFGIRK